MKSTDWKHWKRGCGGDWKKISWRDKVHNDEVFARVNEERCLIKIIRQRQKNWIGHVLRGDGLLRDVMEGRVVGMRRMGKPRKGMISDLKEAFCKEKVEGNVSEEREKKGRKKE